MATPAEERAAKLLHHRKSGLTLGDPVTVPISVSTTFHLPQTQGAAMSTAATVSPTWDAVEAQLALLEGGRGRHLPLRHGRDHGCAAGLPEGGRAVDDPVGRLLCDAPAGA